MHSTSVTRDGEHLTKEEQQPTCLRIHPGFILMLGGQRIQLEFGITHVQFSAQKGYQDIYRKEAVQDKATTFAIYLRFA